MNAVALDTPVRPAAEPRGVLRPVADLATDDAAEVQPWEAHSELSLVSPEVRQRLLELLPEPDTRRVPPEPRPSLPPPVAPQTQEPALRSRELLRYILRRVGETVRLALTIVGAIVVLALLAEALSR
jgi:hypothetical protein